MKKIFTLVFTLMAFAAVASAATVDDLAVLKHSYVLVCDELGARPGKGVLFGDDHFLDVTGGSTATNKGKINLASADGVLVTEEIAAKYGEYGEHYNFLRLKKSQDVIAIKVTAQSKVIIFYQDNNKDDRFPVFAKDASLKELLGAGTISERTSGEEGVPAANLRRIEWTAADDGLVYIGDNNGDMYVSFIIIEAKEAPGTPTVKVGKQTFENGLWFREVVCTPNDMVEEGSTEKIPTIVTYTTDGSTPTAASEVYTGPIKCYKDMTVKFQAFMNFGDGKADDERICDGADNEGNVSFSFNAPSIKADGANVTIESEYEGAKNFYSYGDTKDAEGSTFTLTESATVSAYSQIINGEYATFTTKSTTKDVYVLNPIKEKKTIAVTAGQAVVDEEATATSTTGTIYKIEGGAISADKADFFVKNLTFGVVNGDNAKYQVPEGQEAYIMMSNTNISFMVAEGDSVNVKVITSKNSCKTLNPDNDESITTDRKNYVNVSGKTFGHDDVTEEGGNIIEFGLKGAEGGSIFTFQKYSGTGNILISSIEITPAAAETKEEIDLTAANWGWGWGCDAANEDNLLVGTLTGGWGAVSTGWNEGADWSAYNTLVCVVESAESSLEPGEDGPLFQILAKGTADDKKVAYTSFSETFTTQKTFEIPLDPEYSNDVHQLWFQGKAVGDKIKVSKVYLTTKVADAIQSAKTVKTVNGVRYNLAGQKVDENYKGIVIQNGKKFMQK